LLQQKKQQDVPMSEGPGLFFLGCVPAEANDHGSDVFKFPEGKFRAIYFTKDEDVLLGIIKLIKFKVAEVEFPGAGAISSELKYHFIRWHVKASE